MNWLATISITAIVALTIGCNNDGGDADSCRYRCNEDLPMGEVPELSDPVSVDDEQECQNICVDECTELMLECIEFVAD